jgi:hypothetical protein
MYEHLSFVCIKVVKVRLMRIHAKQKTNSVAFSPQANYTDGGTAASQGILSVFFFRLLAALLIA